MKTLLRFALYAFLFLICFSTYVILFPPQDEPVDLEVSAVGACQFAIKKVANDPSSLEFFHSRESTILKRKDGVWIVKTPFRAKNGYNAIIRTKATCYLQHNGDLWHILEIK